MISTNIALSCRSRWDVILVGPASGLARRSEARVGLHRLRLGTSFNPESVRHKRSLGCVKKALRVFASVFKPESSRLKRLLHRPRTGCAGVMELWGVRSEAALGVPELLAGAHWFGHVQAFQSPTGGRVRQLVPSRPAASWPAMSYGNAGTLWGRISVQKTLRQTPDTNRSPFTLAAPGATPRKPRSGTRSSGKRCWFSGKFG